MKRHTFIKRLIHDATGAVAIEYGVLLALIAVAILASVQGVSSANTGMWTDVAAQVTNAG